MRAHGGLAAHRKRYFERRPCVVLDGWGIWRDRDLHRLGGILYSTVGLY